MALDSDRPTSRPRRARRLPASWTNATLDPTLGQPAFFDAIMRLAEVVVDPVESLKGELIYELVTGDHRVLDYIIDSFQPFVRGRRGVYRAQFRHLAGIQTVQGEMDDGTTHTTYKILIRGEDPNLDEVVRRKLDRIHHV